MIFSCIETRGVNEQMWHAHVLPSNYPTTNPNIQKWNGYRMPWQFYHSFDPKDKRLEVICSEYVGTDGVTYNETNPGEYLDKGLYPSNMEKIRHKPVKIVKSMWLFTVMPMY